MVGSPQGDTIVGDANPNRLDGGVGNDVLDSGGGGGEAYGGPGTDSCTGFSVDHSCGPETGAPPGAASVILNQGLDGSSLVIQGSVGADQMLISNTASGWVVNDSDPVFAGEGCLNHGGDMTVVTCGGGPALSLIVVTGGAGDDILVIDPSVPASARVRANGNAGNDTLQGADGDDVLEAGENYNGPDYGNDNLLGGGGNDVLYADPGADNLDGGIGDDLLVSSVIVCQGHTLDGGGGIDTVSYGRSDAAMRVQLDAHRRAAGMRHPRPAVRQQREPRGLRRPRRPDRRRRPQQLPRPPRCRHLHRQRRRRLHRRGRRAPRQAGSSAAAARTKSSGIAPIRPAPAARSAPRPAQPGHG